MIGFLLFFVLAPLVGFIAYYVGHDVGYNEGYEDCRTHYMAMLRR